jgi:hypothetical protein
MKPEVSYKDRLRAIISTCFGFLIEAGFAETESHRNVMLCGSGIELAFNVCNGELDIFVGPRGAELCIVNLSDLLEYFARAKVDYAAAQENTLTDELRHEDIWRLQAADLRQHLDSVVEFAQTTGFIERMADLKRYRAETVAEYSSQATAPDEIDLASLVGHGLVLIRARLARTPDFRMYQSIEKQLVFIEDLLQRNAVPTAEDKERLNIGLLAAREFETNDPDLADVLFKVDYRARRLGQSAEP